MSRSYIRLGMARAAALAALGAASIALSPAWADEQYQQDRSRCMSGNSGQDEATCLKEAGAAQAERRHGGIDTYGAHRKNAMSRCEEMPDADRADCRARVRGKSTAKREVKTSGSVAGGGILRETVTTVPAAPASGAMK